MNINSTFQFKKVRKMQNLGNVYIYYKETVNLRSVSTNKKYYMFYCHANLQSTYIFLYFPHHKFLCFCDMGSEKINAITLANFCSDFLCNFLLMHNYVQCINEL